jgi:DNA-binding transcriptional LysR family regulator
MQIGSNGVHSGLLKSGEKAIFSTIFTSKKAIDSDLMMTFKQLEALYWVVQLDGFAAAAQKLHTSQSAISKRVQELEALFDTALFDRSLRSARLTEKGEEMFLLARKLLRERDQAVEQFARAEVIERRLRIGVTELTAMTWLPRWVAQVQEHYPKVALEPDVDGSLALYEKLLGDHLDLIIVPEAFTDPSLRSKAIGQVTSSWMCKPGLLPPGKVRLQELGRHRILAQGNASGTGRLYDAWLRERGVEPGNTMAISNLIALLGLTVSGLGISYLPRDCMSPLLAVGMLQELEVEPALPPVPYVALYRGDNRSKLVGSLIMLAQACCDFGKAFQV